MDSASSAILLIVILLWLVALDHWEYPIEKIQRGPKMDWYLVEYRMHETVYLFSSRGTSLNHVLELLTTLIIAEYKSEWSMELLNVWRMDHDKIPANVRTREQAAFVRA